jgi:hypothetical protein
VKYLVGSDYLCHPIQVKDWYLIDWIKAVFKFKVGSYDTYLLILEGLTSISQKKQMPVRPCRHWICYKENLHIVLACTVAIVGKIAQDKPKYGKMDLLEMKSYCQYTKL